MNQNKIYVIAEMACSHEGKPELARTIIDGAGQAAADAIQLQIWSLAGMMAPSHAAYAVCAKLEMSREQWAGIVAYSRERYPRMDVYCCVYEHTSIDFVESLDVNGYKINSSDLSNPYVLDGVAETGRKVNLSVGASTLEEIRSAVTRIKRKSPQTEIILMYGYQNFPTDTADVHLNYMRLVSQLLEMPVGYQDHCDAETPLAFWIPALAVGMGASVLEKHITHDRSLKGVDHESALNPDEFGDFVYMARELELAKGSSEPKSFSEAELKYRKFQKKSIVAKCKLKAGDKVHESNINFLRAAELGIPPDHADRILGKTVKHNVDENQLIRLEDVA